MSAPIEPPPPPPPPAPAATEPAAAGPRLPNRIGVVALIVGIVALVLAFVPFASYGAGLPALAALILGIVAVARGGNRAKRAGIAGLILGIVALIMAIVMSIVYTAVFFLSAVAGNGGIPDLKQLESQLPSDLPSDLASDFPSGLPTDLPTGGSLASAPTTGSGGSVVFEVTGTGKATTIAYAALNDSVAGTDQVTDQTLPWKKTVGVDTGSQIFTVVVQASGSDPVTCTITLNGKQLAKESSGGSGVAACSAHTG